MLVFKRSPLLGFPLTFGQFEIEPPNLQHGLAGLEVYGDPFTFDKMLDILRSRYLHVKEEPGASGAMAPGCLATNQSYVEIVDVDNVLQTHGSISSQFRDGRCFDLLIGDLDAGRIDPLSTPFLKLDVVSWPGVGFMSLHNRRLFCLKRHQDNVRQQQGNVKIRLLVFPLPEPFIELMKVDWVYQKFLRSYDTQDGGQSVKVRHGHGRPWEVHRWPSPPSRRQQCTEQTQRVAPGLFGAVMTSSRSRSTMEVGSRRVEGWSASVKPKCGSEKIGTTKSKESGMQNSRRRRQGRSKDSKRSITRSRGTVMSSVSSLSADSKEPSPRCSTILVMSVSHSQMDAGRR